MDRLDYQIAIISALPLELASMQGMLDEQYESLPQQPEDHNTYAYGRIGAHNVVLACLPSGEYGLVSAANVASRVVQSFPSFKFGLMVGIGGGVPSSTNDIRLGDIVVGIPDQIYSGVVRYDRGKSIQQGKFVRTGMLNRPPDQLLTAVSALRAKHIRTGSDVPKFIADMIRRFPRMEATHTNLGADQDWLFKDDYEHEGDRATCGGCDASQTVTRTTRTQTGPYIHYGTIASGDQILRNAISRDKIANDVGALCFETEAAGLTDFPCLVIRGICDYADSHKNKQWQSYAASAASAYTKELLQLVVSVGSKQRINAQEDESYAQCLRDLEISDSSEDMERILGAKNLLLEGSCDWVFQDDAFHAWWNHGEYPILWIHGDPGKGKTMIMVAAVREFSRRACADPGTCSLAYFFCEGSMQRDAVAIIKGLIYSLAKGIPELTKHLKARQKIQNVKLLYSGPNAIYSLWSILQNMLQDPLCKNPILMIDALDECVDGLTELLELISNASSDAKWFLTSRNVDEIRESLQGNVNTTHTSLELNSVHVSRAVQSFVQSKVAELAEKKRYSEELQSEVREYLMTNAQGTFLWVALVCKELFKVRQKALVSKKLRTFPPQLQPLYDRMLNEALEEIDEELREYKLKLLRLASVSIRPRRIAEISITCELPPPWAQRGDIEEIVAACGSFLVIQDDDLLLVHASAKDYLTLTHKQKVFPNGESEEHARITMKCFELIDNHLQQILSKIKEGASPGDEVNDKLFPDSIPYHLRYACEYWIDHFTAIDITIVPFAPILELVKDFMNRHFLHWLEALSLLGRLSKGVLAIMTLEEFAMEKATDLFPIVTDARRFIVNHRAVIEKTPLQLYSSVLLFSPSESLIRKQYLTFVPDGLLKVPCLEQNWSPCLQLLECPDGPQVIALSFDQKLVASAQRTFVGRDKELIDIVRIWEVRSGMLLFSLPGHVCGIVGLLFQPHGSHLVVSCGDGSEKVWDARTGKLKATLWASDRKTNPDQHQPFRQWRCHLVFSNDGAMLTCARGRGQVTWWDSKRWEILYQSDHFSSVIQLSKDGGLVAAIQTRRSKQDRQFSKCWNDEDNCADCTDVEDSDTEDSDTEDSDTEDSDTEDPDTEDPDTEDPDASDMSIWSCSGCLPNWQPIPIYDFIGGIAYASIKLSQDFELVAVVKKHRGTLEILDVSSQSIRSTLRQNSSGGNGDTFAILEFSPDNTILAVTPRSKDTGLELWEIYLGKPRHDLSFDSSVELVEWFPDSKRLAVSLTRGAIQICDSSNGCVLSSLTGHSGKIEQFAVSEEANFLVSGSGDRSVRIWDTRATLKTPNHVLESESLFVDDIEISLNSKFMATSHYYTNEVRIWEVENTRLVQVLGLFDQQTGGKRLTSKFAHDDTTIAIWNGDSAISVWNFQTGEFYSAFTDVILESKDSLGSMIFATDSKSILSLSRDGRIVLGEVITGKELAKSVLELAQNYSMWMACSWLDRDIVMAGDNRGVVRIWRIVTGNFVHLYTIDVSRNSVSNIAPSPDGECIAVQDLAGGVRIFELRSTEDKIGEGYSRIIFQQPLRSGPLLLAATNVGLLNSVYLRSRRHMMTCPSYAEYLGQ